MKRIIVAVALTAVAAVAAANPGPPSGGGDRGGPGGPPPDGGGMIIGSDGTVYLTGDVQNSSNVDVEKVTAISTSGSVLWTATLPTDADSLVLSGSNLIGVTETRGNSTTAPTSTLTAVATSTGAVAWTLTIDGIVSPLRPFSGGVYAIVVTPPATSGGTVTRQLVAISGAGAVLWKTTLS